MLLLPVKSYVWKLSCLPPLCSTKQEQPGRINFRPIIPLSTTVAPLSLLLSNNSSPHRFFALLRFLSCGFRWPRKSVVDCPFHPHQFSLHWINVLLPFFSHTTAVVALLSLIAKPEGKSRLRSDKWNFWKGSLCGISSKGWSIWGTEHMDISFP